MTKYILYPLFVIALIFASACRKDSIITDTSMESTPPIITVETTVLGLVTDLDGNVLEGALLTLGTSQINSDENGYFKLSGLTDLDNAIVKVEMAGYFDTWHAFQPFDGDIAQTKIRLTPRTNPLNVSSMNGGEVQFDNAKVTFEAESFIDGSGNPYSGEVSVFTAYLDPTDPDLHTFMPGNLTAFDANNRLQLLETFGMINVELEGEAGQKLQITQPATIEMTIPASILNKAPASIPLWYFDTDRARWVEEGSATLQNGKYVGTVTHFSFWNCDVPNDYINLSGQASLGEAGSSLLVCITNLSNDDRRCTYTSANDGFFGGQVPSGETLLLEIFSDCGDPIYSENIGPFNDDVTVGPYVLNPAQTWALVQGNVINCNGSPVTQGYVVGSWENSQGEIFGLNTSGEFSKYINTCGADEITLKAVDAENLKSGDPMTFQLTTNLDVGTLEACENDITTGVFYNYAGNTHIVPNAIINNVPSSPLDSFSLFEIVAYDDQGGGNRVIYNWTIIDWTGQGDFAYGVDETIVGSATSDISVGGGIFGDISLVEHGQQPGEFVIFEIVNVTVTANGIDYPDSNVQIVALIE